GRGSRLSERRSPRTPPTPEMLSPSPPPALESPIAAPKRDHDEWLVRRDGCAGGVVLWRDRTDRRGATSENPQLRPQHQPAAPARPSLTFFADYPLRGESLAGAASPWEGGRDCSTSRALRA